MYLQRKKRIGILFSLFMGILFMTTAQSARAANDLFVDASIGLDSWAAAPNDCRQSIWFGIQVPPCRTLAHAISQAANGDTIYASGGFHERNLVINKNITIEGGAVDADGLGRHFEIRSGRTVELRSMHLHNGNSGAGGSIFNQGTLTIRSVEFRDNSADRGGALFNTIEGTADLELTQFHDNSATHFEGGALYNEGSLSVESTLFVGNSAKTFGGVLYNDEYGLAGFSESNIYESSAENGGALYNMMGALVIINETEIYDSVATVSGGAIVNVQGNLYLDDSLLDNNIAGEKGGALFNTIDGNDTMRIDNVVFQNNSAKDGGAIYDLSANVSWPITNTTFSGNNAELNGGALYLLGTSQITISASSEDESLFSGNTAVAQGGAIYNKVDLTIADSTLRNNTAWEGGAVFNSGSGNLILNRTALTNNTGNYRGGAIFDNSTGTLTTVNSTYSGNDALSYGGAIYYQGALAQLANVTLYGNTAANGSGIYTGSTVQMHNSIITASNVEDCGVTGGGVFTGQRNLIDDFAAGSCSSISPNAISQIDSALTGTPAVHTINGLSNAWDNGHTNCPDPLNGFAPLAVDQQNNNRLGVTVPCDIGAYELN